MANATECMPSDPAGYIVYTQDKTGSHNTFLSSLQAVFFGTALVSFALCAWRVVSRPWVGTLRCAIRRGMLVCIGLFSLEHACYMGLWSLGANDERPVAKFFMTASDMCREAFLIAVHATVFYCVFLTAQTAVRATHTKDTSELECTRNTLLALWAGEILVLVAVCVLRPLTDLWSWSVLWDIYTVCLYFVFVAILFRDLFRIRASLLALQQGAPAAILGALENASTHTRHFMYAATVFCAVYAIGVVEQFRRIANELNHFAAMCYFGRVLYFDLTGPVKIVCVVLALKFAWKSSLPATLMIVDQSVMESEDLALNEPLTR